MMNIEGITRLRQGYGAAGEGRMTKTAVTEGARF